MTAISVTANRSRVTTVLYSAYLFCQAFEPHFTDQRNEQFVLSRCIVKTAFHNYLEADIVHWL